MSGGYLGILNSRVTLGRILVPSDDVVGAAPVVVVSHAIWIRKLGADPSILGRSIWLNGAAFTVVGVSERGFTGTTDTPPAVWAPIATYHVALGGPPVDRTASTRVHIVARIANGVSHARAAMELNAVAAAIGTVREDDGGEPLTGVHFATVAGRINRSEAAFIALVVAMQHKRFCLSVTFSSQFSPTARGAATLLPFSDCFGCESESVRRRPSLSMHSETGSQGELVAKQHGLR